MIFLIGLLIITIDQIIKYIITVNIPLGETIGVGIRITHIANTGMAYGMGKNNQTIIVIANIAIICILVYLMLKNYKNIGKLVKLFLVMIISGGISNLIDRFTNGYVIDYIDINQIFSYPVFNIADIFIVVGAVLLIGYIIIETINKQENT